MTVMVKFAPCCTNWVKYINWTKMLKSIKPCIHIQPFHIFITLTQENLYFSNYFLAFSWNESPKDAGVNRNIHRYATFSKVNVNGTQLESHSSNSIKPQGKSKQKQLNFVCYCIIGGMIRYVYSRNDRNMITNTINMRLRLFGGIRNQFWETNKGAMLKLHEVVLEW